MRMMLKSTFFLLFNNESEQRRSFSFCCIKKVQTENWLIFLELEWFSLFCSKFSYLPHNLKSNADVKRIFLYTKLWCGLGNGFDKFFIRTRCWCFKFILLWLEAFFNQKSQESSVAIPQTLFTAIVSWEKEFYFLN